jgi:uncharacterized membrane protein HdeD (DUF308 family)
MTTDVTGSYSGAPPGRRSGTARTVMAVVGVAALIVGVVLLFSPYAAARTLALLVGLALVISGCLELAAAFAAPRVGSRTA